MGWRIRRKPEYPKLNCESLDALAADALVRTCPRCLQQTKEPLIRIPVALICWPCVGREPMVLRNVGPLGACVGCVRTMRELQALVPGPLPP